MTNKLYNDPHETIIPMSGVEKVNYISMRTIRRYWSVATLEELDCSALLAFLKERKESDERVTFAALIIKLIAATLERHPKMAWMIRRWSFVKPSTMDIGCSVDTGSAVAPVVVVRDAARKSLAEINEDLAQLAAEAEEEQKINARARWIPGWLLRIVIWFLLSLQRFKRHTVGNFQISIIEKFKMDLAVTSTTCVSTMIVGQIKDRALVVDGQVVVRPTAHIALHFEHGICGAHDAFKFLEEFRRLTQHPEEVGR